MKKRISALVVQLSTILVISALYSQQSHAGSAPWVGNTFWETACTGKRQSYGPFDYLLRSQLSGNLEMVEIVHFTPNIENLVSGNSGSLEAELDYTLRAWPNHHRALNSVIRLRLRHGDNFPRSRYTPAECYLQRAIKFSPNDAVTHMLYALLLHRMGYKDLALQSYQTADDLDGNNLQIKYNMGLLLCDMNRYREAKKYADEVYARGFPLPGLRRKLEAKDNE